MYLKTGFIMFGEESLFFKLLPKQITDFGRKKTERPKINICFIIYA